MTAQDLINEVLIPLKTSDSGALAMGLMDEYRVSHLPIVNDQVLLGVISDTDIHNLHAFDEPLGNHPLSLQGAYIRAYQPLYEVIQTMADLKLTLLPVIDDKDQYLGVITLTGLVHHLAQITSIDRQGGIIVLEMAEKDYSLAQLCQIVEANDALILSAYITSFPDSTRLEVTLKINRMELGSILQAFNRYGLTVKSTYANQDSFTEILQERFDGLMNYLNI